jgi:hypothetical protein
MDDGVGDDAKGKRSRYTAAKSLVVDSRDYRQLTHFEIADAKRIYRHLFGSSQTSLHNFQKLQEFGVLGFGFFQDGNVGVGVLPQ